ncbi:uncharacterized protein LOC105844028 isoform X2 [Hydra vulgaris]|uniref:Uncharacterized protein LOC105844028 isoform X2 n=1 Tax=Hydra vulgaris TaxID=6087 RepID=A0ABM4CUZ7_HYDVU
MFFSRKKELCEIHRYLIESQVSTLVIYGMSGVGKTQLAKKYCELYHSFYKNFVWIDAAFGKLQLSMIKIGQKLGFAVQDSKGDYIDVEVIVEKIHNYYKNEKTLYIFDNVDNESVKNFEMYISKEPNSFTLITSQWKIWSNTINKMLINGFSAEEAFAYVKLNIKESPDESIKSLTKEFSFHPFAITQAIKYINIHKISIEKYLDRYRSKPIEILDNDDFPTEEESKSAIKAINIVLIKLEKTKIIPLKILNCLSHCDGQNISKEFIIQISKQMTINEEYLVDEAIRLLLSYSLLDSLDDENFSMHDLTQLSCRHFQTKSSSTSTYLDLLKNYFNFELKKENDHADYGIHFVFHFIHMFRKNYKLISETFHRMTTPIKNLLVCKGLFNEAIEILKAIQTFNAERYGEDNDLTISTKHNIANCLNKMGKYDEALEIYYFVVEIRTNNLGPNHPKTLTAKNNIANCWHELGKYDEALKILYEIPTKILGINDPIRMTTQNNIANCLIKLKNYKVALEILCSVDNIQTETLGSNHPNTMKTKHNIAICFSELGEYEDALKIYCSVHETQTKTLGINHPDTMTTEHNIAYCLIKIKKYNEALEILYPVDKMQTKILGIDHPDTISTKNSITSCLIEMGNYSKV